MDLNNQILGLEMNRKPILQIQGCLGLHMAANEELWGAHDVCLILGKLKK